MYETSERRRRGAEVRDWLMPFLLLCLRGGELEGHDLLRRMAGFGFDVVRPGEVYRALKKAEREGLVTSRGGVHGYLLHRRSYGLTEGGRAYIAFLADSLVAYGEEISTFLQAYRDRSGDRLRGRPTCETRGR